MRKVLNRHTWLIALVILLNAASRYAPDDFLYPVGNVYLSISKWFTGYWHATFAKAAERFLYPGYAYYFADALCWLLVAVYVHATAVRYYRVLAIVFLGFTLNNFLDELLFDPYRLQLNEMLLGIFVLVRASIEYRDLRRQEGS